GGQVDTTLLEQIEETIPWLRRLDDRRGGGGTNLTYVHAQFQAVGLLLTTAEHSGQITRRLLVAWAELGQLAGWMAADAERHGLAQRYYLTALRAAHNADDKALGAHVLGAMARHAARRDEPADAISLGTAAMELAHRSSVVVQALVGSGLAYGYAVAGDAERFHAAYGRARELIEHPTGYRPRWAYYVSPQFVDAVGGSYQVSLGMARSRDSRRQLGHAVTLLTPSATATADQLYPRDALVRRTWLARAHVGRGELEHACEVGQVALERLPQVTSPRGVALLRRLADELRCRKANVYVREFSTELDHRLHLVT
ncbi:MAG: transcriptional regulator, partial [Actinobacteria bacterium]|nr:transcriptional regulator [Actinomycetota bacterium]